MHFIAFRFVASVLGIFGAQFLVYLAQKKHADREAKLCDPHAGQSQSPGFRMIFGAAAIAFPLAQFAAPRPDRDGAVRNSSELRDICSKTSSKKWNRAPTKDPSLELNEFR